MLTRPLPLDSPDRPRLFIAALWLAASFNAFFWIVGTRSGFLNPVLGARRLPMALMYVLRAAMFPGYDLFNKAGLPRWLFLTLFEFLNLAFWCLAFFAVLKACHSLIHH